MARDDLVVDEPSGMSRRGRGGYRQPDQGCPKPRSESLAGTSSDRKYRIHWLICCRLRNGTVKKFHGNHGCCSKNADVRHIAGSEARSVPASLPLTRRVVRRRHWWRQSAQTSWCLVGLRARALTQPTNSRSVRGRDFPALWVICGLTRPLQAMSAIATFGRSVMALSVGQARKLSQKTLLGGQRHAAWPSCMAHCATTASTSLAGTGLEKK